MTTPDFLPYLAQSQLGNAPDCPGKEKDMGIDMGPHKGRCRIRPSSIKDDT